MFVHVRVAIMGLSSAVGYVVVPTRVRLDWRDIMQALGHFHVGVDEAYHVHHCSCHAGWCIDDLLLRKTQHNPSSRNDVVVSFFRFGRGKKKEVRIIPNPSQCLVKVCID